MTTNSPPALRISCAMARKGMADAPVRDRNDRRLVAFLVAFVGIPAVAAGAIGSLWGVHYCFVAIGSYAVGALAWALIARESSPEIDPMAAKPLTIGDRWALRDWTQRLTRMPYGADEMGAAARLASEGLGVRVSEDEMRDAVGYVDFLSRAMVRPKGPPIEWPRSRKPVDVLA